MTARAHNWLIILAACTVQGVSHAQVDSDIVRKANALLGEGDAQAALAAYEAVDETAEATALVAYDKACTHLALGDPEQAIPLLKFAAGSSEDLDIAARARFNLGYLAFQQGSQAAQADPAAAIEHFQRSAAQFQASYDLDSEDPQTPRNIELARLAIRELENRIEEQEQREQEEQQQQQDLAEELDQLAKEQEQLADESREADSSEMPDEQREQQRQDIQNKQQDLNERTEKAKDQVEELQQQKPSEESQRAADQLRQAREEQGSADDSLEQRKLEEAAENQDQAAELLKRAAELLKSESEQQQEEGDPADEDPEKEQPSDDQPGEGQEQQRDAVEEMIQQLLDKERQERENRQRGVVAKPGSIRPVEKDW